MATRYGKPVWRMIKEAIQALGGRAKNAEVVRWVLGRYPGTNRNTVQTQIGYCTVNRPSRVHCSENKKPMLANREKDCLYSTGRGQVALYDPAKHGTWEIASTEDGKLAVRRVAECAPPTSTPRRRGSRYDQIIDTNFRELIARLDHYYRESLGVWRTFGGPSVYFHRKAIAAAREEFLSERHLEYIYATLASWGMHRMGASGAKMTGFADFQASVEANRERLASVRSAALGSLPDAALGELLDGHLRAIFKTLSVSVSEEMKLVANTKALHHILPDLILPVDRQHTVRFFYFSPERFRYTDGRGKRKWRQVPIPRPIDDQYGIFRTICAKTREILMDPRFQAVAAVDARDAPFSTSLL